MNKNVLSFGGGVQTVAMALMCLEKQLPMPDCAIFSDPGWEQEATYKYLEWFIPYCEERGMKFYTVSGGDLRKDALDKNNRWASMPVYTLNEDGKKGMLMRQCTNDYKIQPVYKKVREIMGLKPRQRTKTPAKVWLGITVDEATRMKPSRNKFTENYYPLIEAGLNRQDCINFIRHCEMPIPPKSACIGCPYHSDDFWQDLKIRSPKEFEDACEFDEAVRNNTRRGVREPIFIHRSCKPLREVNFTNGQQDFFENECEGMCGL